ncbi:hypothetical protein ACFT79_12000 [[Kitasatospora] papulosa]
MFKLPKLHSTEPKTIVLTRKQIKGIHPAFLMDPSILRRLIKEQP